MAAFEEVGDVAGFLDLAVGALRVEVDCVLALQGDLSRGAVADELKIERHGALPLPVACVATATGCHKRMKGA